ncbi:Bacillopeptidase F [Orchesella cincta]|uniref:Bacillopeptidase F n=1 Tax=Orchesella cincta TaxID=48709 RepID=A0A1D2MGG0_ORCCI|nr:Bacillopeptidase F [Orchesella cincta]
MIKQLIIILLLGVAHNNAVNPSPKISGSLLKTLESKGTANFIIGFEDSTQPILENVDKMRFETRGHKIMFLKAQLEQHAEESQQSVISILLSQPLPVKYQSFWINNKIKVINASLELVQALTNIPKVKEIREEKIVHEIGCQQETVPASTKQEELVWGVKKIEADQAWNLIGGNAGEGVVVGVAPGAQWVACKGCNANGCTESALISCGEWMVCPTLPNTQQPDCSKAPHIVTSSWTTTQGDFFYVDVVNAWIAANIVPIAGVGTAGTTICRKVSSPGDYENVIGVVATNENDNNNNFNGRGPAIDGSMKPDLTAPGVDVVSSCSNNNGSYCTQTGTEMACSHVAGVAALLLARKPDLTFGQIKNLMQDNADHDLEDGLICFGDNSTYWPNYVYGHGRVNARKALAALIEGSYSHILEQRKSVNMIRKFLLISLLGVALNYGLTSSGKISESLWNTLATKGKASVIISFNEDSRQILETLNKMRFENRGHKITFMKTQLEQLVKESVRNATVELIQTIIANPEVREIREMIFRESDYESTPVCPKQEELGSDVERIEADQAWDLVGGNTGEGVVVGNI